VPQTPYVFISYSQDSDAHVHRVTSYANWLRTNGVEAHVDKYEQSPPQGWALWCHEQVEKSEFVLVVCTATYERRVERKEDPGLGRGATWEGAIISNEIYDATRGQTKFVPVVFDAGDVEHVPFFLRSTSVYDLSDQESAESLYRRLTDQPEFVPPPLGEVQSFPQERLDQPIPVVPMPEPTVQQAPPPTAAAVTPALMDVIEGTWVVQIDSPVFGTQTMQVSLENGPVGSQFQASAIIGPPGWTAQGMWQVLPGEQLALQGTQTMTMPFPQTGPWQALNQFFSITETELRGVTPMHESVIWRRQ
jgi:hypothetical protein